MRKVIDSNMLQSDALRAYLTQSNENYAVLTDYVAMGAYVWALRWISVGGAAQTKSEKLRNDMVDINFVVYGTFFDGLLTADAKATALHRRMIWWLSALRDYIRRHDQAGAVGGRDSKTR